MNPTQKKKNINRINRLLGHAEANKRMIEDVREGCHEQWEPEAPSKGHRRNLRNLQKITAMKHIIFSFITLAMPFVSLAHEGEESEGFSMHNMMGWGGSGAMSWFGWTFMALWWILVVLVIVALVVWITKNTKK